MESSRVRVKHEGGVSYAAMHIVRDLPRERIAFGRLTLIQGLDRQLR